MNSNYPPGAENDPRAPYNEPTPDEVTYNVTVEVFNDDDTSETKELTDVTLELYPNVDYGESDILMLLIEELDSRFDDKEYEILDYNEQ